MNGPDAIAGPEAPPFPDFAAQRAKLQQYSVERESRPDHDGSHIRIRDLRGVPDTSMVLSLVRAANAEGWRLSDYHESGDELLFVPFEDADQAGDEDDEIVTDGGIEIEREDCPRCGGSGEVTEMVAGRSGLAPCPNCDNVPEYAVPNDPPADPKARLGEIEARRDELNERKERARKLRADIRNARDMLSEAANDDLVPDNTGTKFEHVTDQIELLLRSLDMTRGISYDREQLDREKAEIQTLLQHIGEDGESQ
jgi:hypothetical protein